MRKRLRLFTPIQRLAQNVSAVTLIDKIWLSTSGMTPPGPFLARQPGREALSAAVSLKLYSCFLLSHSVRHQMNFNLRATHLGKWHFVSADLVIGPRVTLYHASV